jgi:hypothetical protein
MAHPIIKKIISGGQTGVDRAALDVAIFLEIEHGGWCPRGRRAEDGRIPKIYRLKQTAAVNYAVRTEKNVLDSDGTCLLFRTKTLGGTELTRRLAIKHRRLFFPVDLETAGSKQYAEFAKWVSQFGIQVLNVAGPRESSCPGIGRQSEQFLLKAMRQPLPAFD